MISRPFDKYFIAPNFKCKVEDYRGKKYEWITYAESEEVLRDRLEKKKYTIVQIKKYDFKIWKKKAKEATQDAIDAHDKGEDVNFNNSIWSELKRHLFELFDGKCAYCESKVLHVSSGDVEHYRPKKSPEEAEEHPGYYWLAYHERNLLPACEKCNRARAKMRHFPIVTEDSRAGSPDDKLSDEERILLNPYEDEPKEHLCFIPGKDGVCLGTVKGISYIGKTSVDICNLKRPDLNEERKAEQENTIAKLYQSMGSDRKRHKQLWKDMREGRCQFSQAVLSQAEAWWQERNEDAKTT